MKTLINTILSTAVMIRVGNMGENMTTLTIILIKINPNQGVNLITLTSTLVATDKLNLINIPTLTIMMRQTNPKYIETIVITSMTAAIRKTNMILRNYSITKRPDRNHLKTQGIKHIQTNILQVITAVMNGTIGVNLITMISI